MFRRRHPHAPSSCAWLLALFAGACHAFAFSAGAPLEAAVDELDRAADGVRNAFVQAAAAEVAGAYSAVLSEARREGRAGDVRWIAATEAYIADLKTLARAADAGAGIRFVFGPDGALRIIIGSRPVRQFMLAAPRPHQRGRLERAVLTRFCRTAGCKGSGGEGIDAGRRPISETPAPFAERRGDDGLGCKRQGLRHGKLHQSACARLIDELRALVAALRAFGGAVDWSRFGPVRRAGPSHVVPVDRSGSVVTVDLPRLYRAPAVLADAIPWLQARLAGKVASFQLTPPARLVYGAQVASR